MNNIIATGLLVLSGMVFTLQVNASSLQFEELMARITANYPGLRIAEMEVSKARQERRKLESSLGWMLNSSAAVSHDLSFVGTPQDQLSLSAGLQRQLSSGHSLALSGNYTYQDNSLSISPVLPNPSHNTRLDLSYRIPLQQGADNPGYSQGLRVIDQQVMATEAAHDQFRTRIAEEARNLFYAAAFTQMRMMNTQDAVQRARRLKSYISKNYRLGLAEDADMLQVTAQLKAREAELQLLEVNWKQQRTALNRLLEVAWDSALNPTYDESPRVSLDRVNWLEKIRQFSPELRISQSQLQQADARLVTARDAYKSKLDLILSVGSRTSSGDNQDGSVNEEDFAGEIRLEYQQFLDDSGLDASVKQAQLDRHIAEQEIKRISDEVDYDSRSLLEEIRVLNRAYMQYIELKKSEKKKLLEARRLHRTGRINTAELIRFENDYSAVELLLEQQKIELNSRLSHLQIISGELWQQLTGQEG